MAGDVSVSIQGLDDLKALLKALPDKLRRRALRNALAAGARIVRDAARRRTPVLSAGNAAVHRGYRKPGTVRDAIVVRTSKQAKKAGDVGVFVNVRPAKGAKFRTTTRSVLGIVKIKQRQVVRSSQRGAKSPNDPFYWRFLEFGTKRSREFSFLRPAAAKLSEALEKFKAVLGPQIAKLNTHPKAPL